MMNDTEVFAYRLPTGEVRQQTRRHDQEAPRYAILATADGTSWSLYRMTQREDEIVRCVNELLPTDQSAYVTKPWKVEE